MNATDVDFTAIRNAIASLDPSPRVEPNETIEVDRAFLPEGHRGVLDFKRQLVVGNRGMGKSFWTHALTSRDMRQRLAENYEHRSLGRARVVIGFNGSSKVNAIAPTIDEISSLYADIKKPDLIWRGVLLRVAMSILSQDELPSLRDAINLLIVNTNLYSQRLSQLDDWLVKKNETLLVVFDALDRLARDWPSIRALTSALLNIAVGLPSFSSIRAKIFLRVDQFSDHELFRFPDSSKIRNDHVTLIWRPSELYGLLMFEILRNPAGRAGLVTLAKKVDGTCALPDNGADNSSFLLEQRRLINGFAGEYMGNNEKRGRIYTWVPLHLSDAANNCSPRSFLTAWKKAAEHHPAPVGKAIDHLGLLDGVRSASTSRLAELYEDYVWIRPTLDALRRQFVPIERQKLFDLWIEKDVIRTIIQNAAEDARNEPVGFSSGDQLNALLAAMKSVAVMEERKNGKINVPDIYRVEAEILRKGGVAVPKRG